MPDSQKNVTDSRAFGRQLERELIIGGMIIGTVVGVGLIWLIWGSDAAVTALSCFGLFGLLILAIWLILVGITWLGNH